MHTSPFRPENDRFWSICSEAGIKLCHPPRVRHPLRRAGRGVERGRGDARRHGRVPVGLLLRRPPGDGDRRRRDPAGLVRPLPEDAAAPLRAGHGVGAVHRSASSTTRSSWAGGPRGASSTMRPSDYFKQHCFVAPFPEENVDRVVEAVGIEPIVFGSDFPHGEGPARAADVPRPAEEPRRRPDTKAVMRGNLARFLDLTV